MQFVSISTKLMAAGLIAAALPAASAALGQARQSAARPGPVAVELRDQRGRAMRPEALPPAEQAVLARIRRSMEEAAGSEARGKWIHVECSHPPFRCVITIGRDADAA